MKNEELNIKTTIENFQIKNSNESILDLLQKHSNIRTINALRFFLGSEIRNRKIPFSCVADVPCKFFVESYSFSELKKIHGIGISSFLSLQRILQERGYTLLP
ncbi:hypothetical protein G7074_03015 [Pedobacter sp. HDW13]|uniref:hypothetical protein n=1 Tax=Pedobacter sp. HDW13 TaxID=2714940 RepID=UPI00140D7083|nr:hypothetical protein [Pedobacter sp. HDW13]QIL38339.1 hypothetical protein G7074_03015 [Pedobacter sp. HDW13]